MDKQLPDQVGLAAGPQEPANSSRATSAGRVTTTRAKPVEYSEELAQRILAEVAGGKSLKRTLEKRGMPNRTSFYRWLQNDDNFKQLYEIALTDRADALADDIEDIADDTLKGKYDPNAARVAMDGKKWAASKLRPKKYGDKIDMTTGGEKIGLGISPEQAEQLVRARANRSDTP